MCRSCIEPFDGKYLQQCDYCGHPSHKDNLCGVGYWRVYPTTKGIVGEGCRCKDGRYDGVIKFNMEWI